MKQINASFFTAKHHHKSINPSCRTSHGSRTSPHSSFTSRIAPCKILSSASTLPPNPFHLPEKSNQKVLDHWPIIKKTILNMYLNTWNCFYIFEFCATRFLPWPNPRFFIPKSTLSSLRIYTSVMTFFWTLPMSMIFSTCFQSSLKLKYIFFFTM